MLDVSEATKALLKTDSVYKEMYVTIQNTGSPYIFENEDIYYEAFELKESILDGSDMTFMGCIASEMRITIRNRDNLKDYALNNRKITVEVTPYDRENTKNHLQSLFSAGDELEFNNIKMVVGDDLSLALTRSANADTVINVCDFMVDEDATWLLSGCPNGSAITNRLYGRLTVTNPTTGIETVYNDMGSDVTVNVSRGNIVQYDIIIASGQSTGVTFYPMLRDTDASSEYEGYGTKLIEMDTIPLFTGYIDSGEYDKDKSWLKLTAYDVMYRLNTFNIWNWYNKVAFTQAEGADNKGQIALDDLLDSFASYVNTNSGYEFSLSSRCPVILSSIKIKKRLKNKEMTATNFLKSFCQLACACALINREGELQLIYRNAIITEEDTIRYYRSLTSKDYVITPFSEGITIRTNADDNGITLKHPAIDVETMPTASSSNEGTIVHYVGETTGSYVEGAYYICVEVDENVYEWQETDWDDDDDDTYVIDDDDEMVDYGNYFIEANGIVKKLSKNKRKSILNILLTYVQNSYYAFKAYNLECNGLPYVECGDDIICLDVSKTTHEDTVSGNSLSVNNTDGLEAPITFEFTFNAAEPVYTSIKTIGVFCNQYTGGGGSLGVNLLNVVTMLNDTYVHTGDMIILSKYDGVYDIRYRKKVDNSYIDYDISSCIENIGQSNAWNHDQYLKADTQMSYSITTSGYNVTVKASYDITVETTKLHVPIVNRTLKGIQAMVDIFSFELPDTTRQYGGTTDKKKIGEPENPGNIDRASSSEDMTDVEFTENGTYSPYDYDAMGFSSVEVNVIPDLEELSVTQNGEYISQLKDGYSKVTVNVPSSGGTSMLVWGRSPQVAKYNSTSLKVYNHSYIDGYYIYNSTYLMMGFPGVYAAFDDNNNPRAFKYDMEHDSDVKSTTGVKIAGRNHLVPGNQSTGMLVIGNANTWTGRDENNNILFHAQNSVMELRGGYLLKAKKSGNQYVTLPCNFTYGCCLQVGTEIYIMPYNTNNPNNYLYKSTDWGETWTVDATAPFSADIVIDNAIEYNGKILFFVSSLTIGGIYEYDMILKTFTKIDDHAFGGKSRARLCLFNGKIYMAGGDYSYDHAIANLVFSWDGNVLKTEESIPYEGMYYSGSYYAGRYLQNGQLLSIVTTEHKYLIYYGGGDSSYNSAEYWTAELTEINS